MRLLTRSSLRYLDAHRWQFGLSIVGVALGVAVVVSVDLANASATRAFELSADAVTGRTTHQIVGGPDGVPEGVYVRLRTDLGVRRVAPVVEGYVSLPQDRTDAAFTSRRPLRLLGVDPFSEGPFRASTGTGPLQTDLGRFLTAPDAVLMSADTAADLGVAVGDRLQVQAGPRRRDLLVAGVIAPESRTDSEAIADLLVSDISTAQEILASLGALTRIDIIADEAGPGGGLLDDIRRLLPPGLQLVTAAARTETTRQMTRAFRLNLTALSLLAMVCGVFLVYNTMSFSVVQRRTMIGTMRAIGVTRNEIFRLIIAEAAIVGLAGTIVGLAGGVAIGRLLVSLVTQTINDLYFVVAVRDLALDPLSLAKGAALGVLGSVLAALPAAIEATGAAPRAVLLRSQLEARARRRAFPLAVAGAVLLLLGFGLLSISGHDLVLSFAALFLTISGFALLTPGAIVVFMGAAVTPMTLAFGPLGRIATRGVTASLSRTAVAIAALMIAVSVVIGVGVMIDSFRGTVTRWLGAVLVADLYVAPLAPGATPAILDFDNAARARVETTEGVQRISTVRGVDLPNADGGRTRLVVFDIDERGKSGFEFTTGDPASIWDAFDAGESVIVTEPYAYRHDTRPGSRIELLTDAGTRSFDVAGIYYNYASEEGLVAMGRRTYERFWNDRAISGFSVYLDTGAELAPVSESIRAALEGSELIIRSNRALRQISLDVFDRTFLITGVLRMLVTLVAVVGVLSALMSLQLERAREIGVLRALGLTPREVWGLNASQSGLMGLVSGALALPVGVGLAAIMIFVINRRSFGWTLDMNVSPWILLQAFALAVVASLLAGMYPAYRTSTTRPAVVLREE